MNLGYRWLPDDVSAEDFGEADVSQLRSEVPRQQDVAGLQVCIRALGFRV